MPLIVSPAEADATGRLHTDRLAELVQQLTPCRRGAALDAVESACRRTQSPPDALAVVAAAMVEIRRERRPRLVLVARPPND